MRWRSIVVSAFFVLTPFVLFACGGDGGTTTPPSVLPIPLRRWQLAQAAWSPTSGAFRFTKAFRGPPPGRRPSS